jgi:hypothetical protein
MTKDVEYYAKINYVSKMILRVFKVSAFLSLLRLDVVLFFKVRKKMRIKIWEK